MGGKKASHQAFPVINKMDGVVIDILPAVHALTSTIFIMTIVSM